MTDEKLAEIKSQAIEWRSGEMLSLLTRLEAAEAVCAIAEGVNDAHVMLAKSLGGVDAPFKAPLAAWHAAKGLKP